MSSQCALMSPDCTIAQEIVNICAHHIKDMLSFKIASFRAIDTMWRLGTNPFWSCRWIVGERGVFRYDLSRRTSGSKLILTVLHVLPDSGT